MSTGNGSCGVCGRWHVCLDVVGEDILCAACFYWYGVAVGLGQAVDDGFQKVLGYQCPSVMVELKAHASGRGLFLGKRMQA